MSAACGDTAETPGRPGSAVRDSAGIIIVDNQAPEPAFRLGWTIGDTPEVAIGVVDGPPEDQLFRVEDALRLDDGRILVANAGTSEIRTYDALGAFVASWGGEGEGPGEFTGLATLARWPGDSIVAWDFSQSRLTLFGLDGSLGRTASLPLGDQLGPGSLEGILPDGSLLVSSQISFGSPDQPSGLARRSRAYLRLAPDGAQLDGFGRYLDEEYYIRPDVMAIMRHPFRRSVHTAVWQDRVIISPSDRYEIRGFDERGTLGIIVRRRHELAPVEQADLDRVLDARLAAADPEARARMGELFQGFPLVESFPAFSEVLVDSEGFLWVKEYAPPDSDQSVWCVFDPDGRVLGHVETPPGLDIYEIGPDYLLGRAIDEFEVERVELWRLSRS